MQRWKVDRFAGISLHSNGILANPATLTPKKAPGGSPVAPAIGLAPSNQRGDISKPRWEPISAMNSSNFPQISVDMEKMEKKFAEKTQASTWRIGQFG